MTCKEFLLDVLERCNANHLQVLGKVLVNIRQFCSNMPFTEVYRSGYHEWYKQDFIRYLDEVEERGDEFTKIEVNIAFLTIFNTMNLMTEYFNINPKILD